ncbi:MAG: hypothetical protein Q8S54_19255 [Bacteroidota bacterium]|nr:hypothetical protein [Odoribacter sp.]MDP3645309.1 hypothetical protein [Bacteroidota bacterium]
MKPIDEFQEVGKNLPYQTPDKFFDQLSEKILQKAKNREQSHKKMLILWRPVVAVASLVAMVFLGYLFYETGNEDLRIVQENQGQTEQLIKQKSELSKGQAVEVIKKDLTEKSDSEARSTENMDDVLTDLTDEDLMQLAAMYETDPFTDKAMQ